MASRCMRAVEGAENLQADKALPFALETLRSLASTCMETLSRVGQSHLLPQLDPTQFQHTPVPSTSSARAHSTHPPPPAPPPPPPPPPQPPSPLNFHHLHLLLLPHLNHLPFLNFHHLLFLPLFNHIHRLICHRLLHLSHIHCQLRCLWLVHRQLSVLLRAYSLIIDKRSLMNVHWRLYMRWMNWGLFHLLHPRRNNINRILGFLFIFFGY
ncbi:Zinc finger protein 40 [Bienertia sinuspersici]